MKKEGKIVAYSIIGLFFISMLASIVIAPDAATSDVTSNFLNKILSAFGSSTGATADFLKNIISPDILFAVLIFLVIFAIVKHVPIFNKPDWLPLPLSIVIALLSAAFIPVDFIRPLLNQYTALGVTLTLLLPFVLIFYFLKEIAPFNRNIQKIVWGVFLVIVLINAYFNWVYTTEPITNFTKVLYFFIMLGSVVMYAKGDQILTWIWKEELYEAAVKYDEILDLVAQNNAAEARKALNQIGSQLPESTREKLSKLIENLGEAAAKPAGAPRPKNFTRF